MEVGASPMTDQVEMPSTNTTCVDMMLPGAVNTWCPTKKMFSLNNHVLPVRVLESQQSFRTSSSVYRVSRKFKEEEEEKPEEVRRHDLYFAAPSLSLPCTHTHAYITHCYIVHIDTDRHCSHHTIHHRHTNTSNTTIKDAFFLLFLSQQQS